MAKKKKKPKKRKSVKLERRLAKTSIIVAVFGLLFAGLALTTYPIKTPITGYVFVGEVGLNYVFLALLTVLVIIIISIVIGYRK